MTRSSFKCTDRIVSVQLCLVSEGAELSFAELSSAQRCCVWLGGHHSTRMRVKGFRTDNHCMHSAQCTGTVHVGGTETHCHVALIGQNGECPRHGGKQASAE